MGIKINFDEMKGKVYGRLTVIGDTDLSPRKLLVRCICGKEKLVAISHLRNGNTVSCGCIVVDNTIKRNTTHGLSKHPLNRVWRGMIDRCNDVNNNSYRYYGLKGIKVCDEWMNDFLSFYNWAIENRWVKKMNIDRIDFNGNYEPNNCRVVTAKENNRNKSDNKILEFNGEKMCLVEWAEKLGVPRVRISDRLNKLGWSIEEALTKNKITKYADRVK